MQVNGINIKKSSSCMLNSGDEVVFGANHAYVSFSLFLIFFLSSFPVCNYVCVCVSVTVFMCTLILVNIDLSASRG